ncbi:hypothetical protein GCM10008904_10070 [Paraclostridium ghonii]|uniref:Uncharacterized protein n=1 Tax=Paraclostridium ghonii TaxID=29358 RepID=A0ABU0MZD2_9FIRM|nr:hypothetical protein [Paeniclostridium ghonii]MDQ0555964.1 hypothetical protein [Paeniclostridium ghonii]
MNCEGSKLIKTREYEEGSKIYTQETLKLLDCEESPRTQTSDGGHNIGFSTTKYTLDVERYFCTVKVNNSVPSSSGGANEYKFYIQTDRFTKYREDFLWG